jgi:hypothetical protein
MDNDPIKLSFDCYSFMYDAKEYNARISICFRIMDGSDARLGDRMSLSRTVF